MDLKSEIIEFHVNWVNLVSNAERVADTALKTPIKSKNRQLAARFLNGRITVLWTASN